MLSSAEPVDPALHRAAETIIHRIGASAGDAVTVLIDGRSGAGKTTLARIVADQWPGPVPPQRVALDELYPGWDGLRAGVDMARDRVLVPRASGADGGFERWDWASQRPGLHRSVSAAASLVMEGSGLLRADTAHFATVSVWIDGAEPARRSRALARDGETYRPHWRRWAAQEEAHVRDNSPRSRADIVVEISPS